LLVEQLALQVSYFLNFRHKGLGFYFKDGKRVVILSMCVHLIYKKKIIITIDFNRQLQGMSSSDFSSDPYPAIFQKNPTQKGVNSGNLPNRLRPTSLKLNNAVPISTISELYSSYDDEKLNIHHLNVRHMAAGRASSCSSSSVSSLASSIIDMTLFKKRSISSKNLTNTTLMTTKELNRKLPIKYRNNKSVGGGLDRLGFPQKETQKRNSYIKNFCFAVSCAGENGSTYRNMKLNSTINNQRRIKKKSFSSSRGVSSSPFGPRPRLTNNDSLCQEIKFVSTDEFDDDDNGHFKRDLRRDDQSGIFSL